MKRQLSFEEQEILREEWRRRNPQEAARRAAKKMSESECEKQRQEELENENLLLTELPRSEEAEEAYRKQIKEVLDYIVFKREQYVQDRDLEASKLSAEIKERFFTYVKDSYDCRNQSVASAVGALLIEGLRYPDKELNNFAFNFMKDRESETEEPNWAFWMALWSTEFVPLDAVRLMLKIEDGRFKAIDSFRELVSIIYPKIIWHMEQEYKRLEWAESLTDSNVRSREVGRKSKRIFYFQALLGAYGIAF